MREYSSRAHIKLIFGICLLISLKAEAQLIFNARINQYDPELHNEKIAFSEISIDQESQMLSFGDSKWNVEYLSEKSLKGDQEIKVVFRCIDGQINNASVSIDVEINDWSIENYLLMPSAVYNGNRYPALIGRYLPFWNEPRQLGLNKPILLSNQPRLNHRDGASKIQLRSGALAIPSVGIQNPKTQTGTWLFFEQGNEQGDYGVTFVENKSRNKAVFSLISPIVREKTRYARSTNNDFPSHDVPANFVTGDVVTINLKSVQFEAANRQKLFDKWTEYRESYHPKKVNSAQIPLSEAFKIIEKKFNRQNWRDVGYYAVGTNGKFFQEWQIGWTGGMITTLPFLIDGSELTRKRVLKNFDWLFENGVAASGYYYDTYYENQPYEAYPFKPLCDSLLLTRKNADGTYYIYKQLMAMKALGIPVKEKWELGNKNALEAQMATWEKYGQLGQWVNQETGRLVIGNSTSAGIFPASLCAAYAYTGNKEYMSLAEEIGEYFYTNFISKGLIFGGPGDALQSFDSESSYGTLVSMVDLYETTKDEKWLKRAREMANQFSTWVVGYDFQFPEGSAYHQSEARTTGTVYANTQNTHAAPGICTHSGEALFKLYRFTNEPFYLSLIADIVSTLPQFMSWSKHPIDCLEEGWVNERINMIDWGGEIGGNFCGSTWSETSLLLGAIELPAVYIDKDTEEVTVFDQVQAKVLKKNKHEFWVEVTNTTSEPANLKILAENYAERTSIYGYNPNLKWDKIKLNSGEKKLLKFNK